MKTFCLHVLTVMHALILFIVLQNDSYATLSPIESSIAPLHEVSTPPHDFSEFNIQRKNSLISVMKLTSSSIIYLLIIVCHNNNYRTLNGVIPEAT